MNEKFFTPFFCRRRVQAIPKVYGYGFGNFITKRSFKSYCNKIEMCRLFFAWTSFSRHQNTKKIYKSIVSLQNNKNLKRDYFFRFIFHSHTLYINTCIEYNNCIINTLEWWRKQNYKQLGYILRISIKDHENKKLECKLDDIERQINCCICFQKKKNILFSPCNHVVCCKECSMRVDKCPCCKADIKYTTKIFI